MKKLVPNKKKYEKYIENAKKNKLSKQKNRVLFWQQLGNTAYFVSGCIVPGFLNFLNWKDSFVHYADIVEINRMGVRPCEG